MATACKPQSPEQRRRALERQKARRKAALVSDESIREYARERAWKTGAAQLFARTPAPGGWIHHYVDGQNREQRVWVPAY